MGAQIFPLENVLLRIILRPTRPTVPKVAAWLLPCLFRGLADLSLCLRRFFASGPLQQLDSRGIYCL